MKELLLKLADILGLAYWIEIATDSPKCTYYFGPFLSKEEAEQEKGGYLDDLKGEGAMGIRVAIKQTKPSQLTIFDEADETVNFKKIPVFGR
jgi:hypothetical protein